MLYFSILTLLSGYNASLSNVNLIAMCNSLDFDKDGIEAIFKTIVTELSELENHGFYFAIPGQESI